MRVLILNDLWDQRIGSSVRQMYQHETKLKEELKALNDQLSAKEQAL